MRLAPYIKKNLRTFIREGKITLVCFIIFPIVMANIYGKMQENMFSGKSSFEPIKVQFVYDKSSNVEGILSGILKLDSVKSFIQEVKDEGKCKVTIGGNFNDIKIEKLSGTDNEMDMVKNFMQGFAENINQYKVAEDNISTMNLSPEQQADLTGKIMAKIQEISQAPVVKEEIMPGYRTLGAREYYTISMFSFTSIMIISVLVKAFHRDKKQGVVRRSFSTPNSKVNYLLGFAGSTFILCLVVNFIYIIINMILGTAFTDHTADVLMLAVLQSLLQAAVVGTIITFIANEKLSDIIMTICILLPSVIGGVFFNSDIIEIKALKLLSDFSPNSLILNSYKGVSIVQGISGAQGQILIMIILSVILLSASIIRAGASWGEQ
ncbi:MAG: ABC transporter permease [Bacillota bacterium]|nr:ABC transporter permease [Bacillota bacterium]